MYKDAPGRDEAKSGDQELKRMIKGKKNEGMIWMQVICKIVSMINLRAPSDCHSMPMPSQLQLNMNSERRSSDEGGTESGAGYDGGDDLDGNEHETVNDYANARGCEWRVVEAWSSFASIHRAVHS